MKEKRSRRIVRSDQGRRTIALGIGHVSLKREVRLEEEDGGSTSVGEI